MVYIETLKEYLLKNNIYIKDNYFRSNRNQRDQDILKQINLISEVDNILTNYSLVGYTRLSSTIGKKVECFKVQLRKLKIDLEYRETMINLNNTDLFILQNGEKILKKGWDSISLLKEINYLELIKRSMKLNEICLGKTDESNLRKDKFIEIGKIKNVSHNLLEEDAYSYLKKICSVDKEFKKEYYIDEFISTNKLSKDSKDYINILLQFPSETLRQWSRYREGKRQISSEDYFIKISNALKNES